MNNVARDFIVQFCGEIKIALLVITHTLSRLYALLYLPGMYQCGLSLTKLLSLSNLLTLLTISIPIGSELLKSKRDFRSVFPLLRGR